MILRYRGALEKCPFCFDLCWSISYGEMGDKFVVLILAAQQRSG